MDGVVRNRDNSGAPQRNRRSGAASLDPRTEIFDAKLRPPLSRPGTIARTELVDRILTRQTEPVIAVVAPAGYGKTTVLAEWAARQPGDVAWVSIDDGDNDPSALLAATAVAISRVQPIDPNVIDAVTARTTTIPTALRSLTGALSPAGMTLVLDHVEAVANTDTLDMIAELVWRLPGGSRLAYASRTPIPLPNPLLRSRGALVEIGPTDLAMNRHEAQQLLTATGAKLTNDEIDVLYEQTEGWPAGLYLAALASHSRRPTTAFTFHGDDVLMGDYLRTEILAHLPTDTVTFLTRTSILDQLCGPLCDAVTGNHDSQTTLETLDAANLMVVPLDRQRHWYRYHRLFRDLLTTELQRREPDLITHLHHRAALWLHQHDMNEPAIRHAQRSGDAALVVKLVAAAMQPAYAAGRAADARTWLEWFRTNNLIEQHPNVAVVGALVEALSGRTASTERWTAAAEAAATDPSLEHDETFVGTLAFLRSLLCRNGPAQMRADAQLALRALDTRIGFRTGALVCEAVSHLLEGNIDLAEPILARAYDVGMYAGSPAAAVFAAGFRGLVALRRHDWDHAEILVAQGLANIEAGHLQDNFEGSIVYAVAAQCDARRGDVRRATEHLALAARLRPLLTYAVPASALIQLEIARAYLQVADTIGARTLLREVRDILHQRPDLGVVAAEAVELDGALSALQQGPVGASSLTTAELRLLPFLATHLSFPEIGERLHISRHTVKTQAISVYRKFGVSSRSEAIQHAQSVGLLRQ